MDVTKHGQALKVKRRRGAGKLYHFINTSNNAFARQHVGKPSSSAVISDVVQCPGDVSGALLRKRLIQSKCFGANGVLCGRVSETYFELQMSTSSADTDLGGLFSELLANIFW